MWDWTWMFLFSLVFGEPYYANSKGKAVFCYFRSNPGYFDVEDIDPSLCTHMAFAFAGLDVNTNELEVMHPYNDLFDNGGKGAYSRFTRLKLKNPNLKTLLSIGGGNGGSYQYSIMAADPRKREIFIASVIRLMDAFNFDGIDMDWEFPNSVDKDHYVALLRELKSAFKPNQLMLTAAVCATKACIDEKYDVPNMSKYLDFINVMTYDLRGYSRLYTSHHSGLYGLPVERDNPFYPGELLNSNFSMNYWIHKGAKPYQLLMGIPAYGYQYILRDPEVNGFYAPAEEGEIWHYNSFCVKLQTEKGNWTIVRDPNVVSPYAHNGKSWFCFDDAISVKTKSKYILEMGLGGGMVWSTGSDDSKGACGGKKFPILSELHESLIGN